MKKIECYFIVILFLLPMGHSEIAAACSHDVGKTICFQDVADMARTLVKQKYLPPDKSDIPESLKKIGYDQWMDIQYNPVKSLWANDSFRVQFFHRGFLFPERVIVNYVEKNEIKVMPFSSDLFKYKKREKYRKQLKGDIGFSGLRIHYPLNPSDNPNELISFIGASYFRALAKGLYYGLSARGLAVNTVENIGEEFPRFREFWIIRPLPVASEITVYALMDSVSLTGAYEFVIRPGEATVMDVKSTVFIRKPVKKLGIAPLSSMFCYGEHCIEWRNGDFRPEVHDSDGLLIKSKSGEWIWHPVVNPKRLLINSFPGGQPSGFGLLQRDTNFDHYQDLQARYDLRPSVWVEPKGDWGNGHIELFELPTAGEWCDNIGAYWVPEKPFKSGDFLDYAYALSWYSEIKRSHQLCIADSTRVDRKQNQVMFVIDFLPVSKEKQLFKTNLKADIRVSNGYRLSGSELVQNPVTGGVRLIVHIRFDKSGFLNGVIPKELPAVDLAAFIKKGNDRVTETWTYTYQP